MNAQIPLIEAPLPLIGANEAPALPAAPFGEADHRIANSLAAISGLVRIAARQKHCENPAVLLMEVADRIESVAALHHLVAQSSSANVCPKRFLKDICERQRAAMANDNLTLNFTFRNEQAMPSAQVMPLALITLELLSNSIKYAHPAATWLKVDIEVEQTPTHLMFDYEDDGVGFPEGFDFATSGDLGLRYINVLSQKLSAVPKWRSDDLGMRFSLRIPFKNGTPGRAGLG
jgi:two-component sensor histidine kinase